MLILTIGQTIGEAIGVAPSTLYSEALRRIHVDPYHSHESTPP